MGHRVAAPQQSTNCLRSVCPHARRAHRPHSSPRGKGKQHYPLLWGVDGCWKHVVYPPRAGGEQVVACDTLVLLDLDRKARSGRRVGWAMSGAGHARPHAPGVVPPGRDLHPEALSVPQARPPACHSEQGGFSGRRRSLEESMHIASLCKDGECRDPLPADPTIGSLAST